MACLKFQRSLAGRVILDISSVLEKVGLATETKYLQNRHCQMLLIL